MEKEQKCHFDITPNKVDSRTGCVDEIQLDNYCNSWFYIFSFWKLSVLGYCSTGE